MANILEMRDTTADFAKNDIEKNKFYALVSYIGILWLIPLLAARDSKFAQFHANQGILLTILGAISGIIAFIPFIGGIVAWILGIACTALMIIGALNCVQGKARELPFIGSYRLIK